MSMLVVCRGLLLRMFEWVDAWMYGSGIGVAYSWDGVLYAHCAISCRYELNSTTL